MATWTARKMDFRGILPEDPVDRRFQQRALNRVRFVPYFCRTDRERPKRLRSCASRRRTATGRQSASRRAPRRPAGNGRTAPAAAASGGGGDDGGDGSGPGDGPPPTNELLAF